MIEFNQSLNANESIKTARKRQLINWLLEDNEESKNHHSFHDGRASHTTKSFKPLIARSLACKVIHHYSLDLLPLLIPHLDTLRIPPLTVYLLEPPDPRCRPAIICFSAFRQDHFAVIVIIFFPLTLNIRMIFPRIRNANPFTSSIHISEKRVVVLSPFVVKRVCLRGTGYGRERGALFNFVLLGFGLGDGEGDGCGGDCFLEKRVGALEGEDGGDVRGEGLVEFPFAGEVLEGFLLIRGLLWHGGEGFVDANWFGGK